MTTEELLNALVSRIIEERADENGMVTEGVSIFTKPQFGVFITIGEGSTKKVDEFINAESVDETTIQEAKAEVAEVLNSDGAGIPGNGGTEPGM